MSKATPILGKYRITHMDEWDQDFVDVEIPAFVLFHPHGQPHGHGEFHFGHAFGQMDCEQTIRDGKQAVEWTFDGHYVRKRITGRGWVLMQKDGTLKGKFYIHNGKRSGFTAERDLDLRPIQKPRPKVRALDVSTGKVRKIAAHKLTLGPIRHETLSDALLGRIRAIHTALKGVFDMSLEQFEVNFMRDSDPEPEVTLWEDIVAGMERVTAEMPEVERRLILGTLLGYSMGPLTKKELANPEVRRILRIAGWMGRK